MFNKRLYKFLVVKEQRRRILLRSVGTLFPYFLLSAINNRRASKRMKRFTLKSIKRFSQPLRLIEHLELPVS